VATTAMITVKRDPAGGGHGRGAAVSRGRRPKRRCPILWRENGGAWRIRARRRQHPVERDVARLERQILGAVETDAKKRHSDDLTREEQQGRRNSNRRSFMMKKPRTIVPTATKSKDKSWEERGNPNPNLWLWIPCYE
jgi:hypothetical protein